MAEQPDRHPRNAPGPFYVVNGECVSCGAPEMEAESLLSHDDNGHCFFLRQPVTEDETDAAIRSVRVSCCGALRYGGDGPEVLRRLAELDLGSMCDQRPDGSYVPVVRNRARFKYGTSEGANSKRTELREIVSLLADSLADYPDGKCTAFRIWPNKASFRYRWGKRWTWFGYSAKFEVESEGGGCWLLRISRHELAQTSLAIRFDTALQKNEAFQSIQWFAESQ